VPLAVIGKSNELEDVQCHKGVIVSHSVTSISFPHFHICGIFCIFLTFGAIVSHCVTVGPLPWESHVSQVLGVIHVRNIISDLYLLLVNVSMCHRTRFSNQFQQVRVCGGERGGEGRSKVDSKAFSKLSAGGKNHRIFKRNIFLKIKLRK
jgi:hypothetical protein